LFAKDRNDKRLKTFGLDRIINFENTLSRFDYPLSLDVNEIFRHCFGVINLEDCKPEEVVLSFDAEQGKYIKSYPIHESQKIITENNDEFRIMLQLCITHDLIMEILSHGDTVEIIAPKKLKETILKIHRNSITINEKR
jgi:predicted DNA-binding transcriptional regulator YafY